MKTVERPMVMLDLDNRPPNREQPENQLRKPNFRILPPPVRNQRDLEDQQIIPPFPDNFVDEEEENDPMDNQIHHFDDLDSGIYLKEEEHNIFSQEDDCNTLDLETK